MHHIERERTHEGNGADDNEIEGEGGHLGASRAARRRCSGALHGDRRSGSQLKSAGVAGAAFSHPHRQTPRAGNEKEFATKRAGAPIWVDGRLTRVIRTAGREVRSTVDPNRCWGGEGSANLYLRPTLGDADQSPDAARREEPKEDEWSNKEWEKTDQRGPVWRDHSGDERADPGEELGDAVSNFTHRWILAGARRSRCGAAFLGCPPPRTPTALTITLISPLRRTPRPRPADTRGASASPSERSARWAADDVAEVAGADHRGAERSASCGKTPVIRNDDDAVRRARIWRADRLDDFVISGASAPITKDLDCNPRSNGPAQRRLKVVEAPFIPPANKVIAVHQQALRVAKGDALLIYHRLMLLCVDLDGVVYRGSEPVPGVGPLLTERVAAGDRVIYVTNNSFLRRVEYRSRIEACGAPLSTHGIVTAASAVAQHFVEKNYRHILVYGADGLAAELRDAGLDACRTAEFDGPESLAVWGVDAVTVGLDREADWHDLAIATDAVRAGAPLIVPNRDANYPDPGRLVPGTGAAVAALEAATGVRATAIGKPAPDLLQQAAALDGSNVRDAIMIGDSPATDIAAANAAGCRSILLMTGVGAGVGAVQIDDLPAAQRPTWVARDAAEMASILAAAEANGAARG